MTGTSKVQYADDSRVVSYYIMTDRNHLTTRHRRYLKPLHPEHDQKFIANINTDTSIADLPNIIPNQVPRRSGRISKAKAIRLATMGSEISSLQTPFSANIEITFGEEELVRVREVWRNTTTRNREQVVGEQAGQNDRQEHAAIQAGVSNAGGAGTVTTGDEGVTRTGGAVTTMGGAGVTRAGGATGGQRRDIGGAELAMQGCSTDSTGSGKTRNVTFVKAGKCHRLGCNKGNVGRRHNQLTGSITPASTNKSGKRKITETITLAGSNSDSSDNEESLEEMEKRLAKMLELKFKRRKGPNSSN